MPLENALKSIRYTYILLFLTVGTPDLYQTKNLGKSATDFYTNIQMPEKVPNKY